MSGFSDQSLANALKQHESINEANIPAVSDTECAQLAELASRGLKGPGVAAQLRTAREDLRAGKFQLIASEEPTPESLGSQCG